MEKASDNAQYDEVKAVFKVFRDSQGKEGRQETTTPYVEGAESGTIKIGSDFTIVLPAFQSPSYSSVFFQFDTSDYSAGIYVRVVEFVSGEPTRLLVTQADIVREKPFKPGDVAVVKTNLFMISLGAWVRGKESTSYTFT
ncbi:MAG TPA: hypothetical protein VF682_20000 [Pseudomonas sp.]|jgi:hypothetical protein